MPGRGRGERDLSIVEQVLAGGTLAQVAREYGLSRQRVWQIVHSLRPDFDGARRAARAVPEKGPRGRPRLWSDAAVLAALRAAAAGGRALSAAQWRRAGIRPSASVVIARFGSWSAACRAAGLEVSPAPGPAGADRALVEAVAAFLADPRVRDQGVRAYILWARAAGAPSPTALRNRFGSWSRAKALAAEHLARTRGNPRASFAMQRS